MSGYRFCRTDDVPLLVAAYNECWRPHFPAEPALTVEAFKRGVRHLNLWASSSMLAFSGDETVAVLLGAKRDTGNLIHALAVRPGEERRGHGRHLVDSLLRKVAILGPPRLEVEVAADDGRSRRFFEACGFAPVARYADFTAEAFTGDGARAPFEELAAPVRLDELFAAGVLSSREPRAWQRSAVTIRNRRDELSALAVASDERIEAYVVAHKSAADGSVEVVALGAPRGEEVASLLRMLLQGVAVCARRSLRIPRLSEAEVPFSWLTAWGFRKEREYQAYVATATS